MSKVPGFLSVCFIFMSCRSLYPGYLSIVLFLRQACANPIIPSLPFSICSACKPLAHAYPSLFSSFLRLLYLQLFHSYLTGSFMFSHTIHIDHVIIWLRLTIFLHVLGCYVLVGCYVSNPPYRRYIFRPTRCKRLFSTILAVLPLSLFFLIVCPRE